MTASPINPNTVQAQNIQLYSLKNSQKTIVSIQISIMQKVLPATGEEALYVNNGCK